MSRRSSRPRTSHPRRTSHTRLARANSLTPKEIAPTSQPRSQIRQASVARDARTAALLAPYDDDLVVRFAPKTVASYRAVLRHYVAWLEARGLSLTAVTSADLLAYQRDVVALRRRDGQPYSADHQMQHVTVLKGLYGFLVRRGVLLANPTGLLVYPRVEQRLPRAILSQADVRAVLDTATDRTPRGLRDRAILETLYATGLRAGELVRLTLRDVDTEDRLLRILLGKGRKDRTVPLTRAAAAAIEAYLVQGRPRLRGARTSPYLFLARRGGRLYSSALCDLVTAALARAGVDRHATCHTFRHSAATHLLKGGADIRHIQQLLGHTSLATTERYTRVEISDLKEVLRRAHPRGR
jgi:integrase/recombinase XerD